MFTSVQAGVSRDFNILYTEIHVLCLVILCIAAYKERESSFSSAARLHIIRIAQFANIMIISNIIWKWIDTGVIHTSTTVSLFIHTCYYICEVMVYYYLYLYSKFQAGKTYSKYEKRILLIPFAFTMLLHLINTVHPFLYTVAYIDQSAHMEFLQLPYFKVGVVIPYSLVMCTALYNLYNQFRKGEGREVRRGLINAQYLAIAITMFGTLAKRLDPIPLYPVVISFGVFLHYFKEVENEVVLDPLTKIYNKREFLHMLGKLKDAYHQDDNLELYLIMLDVNDFKEINDKYGHDIGDLALIYVAENMKKALAPYRDPKAYGYRFGGDEFCIIMRSYDEEEVRKMLATLVKLELVLEDGKKVEINLSYGYCGYETWMGTKDFLNKVDHALYENKRRYHAAKLKKNVRVQVNDGSK